MKDLTMLEFARGLFPDMSDVEIVQTLDAEFTRLQKAGLLNTTRTDFGTIIYLEHLLFTNEDEK